MLKLKLILPGECASKKTSQTIVKIKTKEGKERRFIVQDNAYIRWFDQQREAVLSWMQTQQMRYKSEGLIWPVAYCELELRFLFGDLKPRDGVNKENAILDLLKDLHVIEDDQWLNVDACTWRATLDRDFPRTEITLLIKDVRRSPWRDMVLYRSRSKKARTLILEPVPAPEIEILELVDADTKLPYSPDLID